MIIQKTNLKHTDLFIPRGYILLRDNLSGKNLTQKYGDGVCIIILGLLYIYCEIKEIVLKYPL